MFSYDPKRIYLYLYLYFYQSQFSVILVLLHFTSVLTQSRIFLAAGFLMKTHYCVNAITKATSVTAMRVFVWMACCRDQPVTRHDTSSPSFFARCPLCCLR